MLRLWGSRRGNRGRGSGRGSGRGAPGPGKPVKIRKYDIHTKPPETLSKHLLPCHVRLLDGTDLYIQLLVRFKYSTIGKILYIQLLVGFTYSIMINIFCLCMYNVYATSVYISNDPF